MSLKNKTNAGEKNLLERLAACTAALALALTVAACGGVPAAGGSGDAGADDAQEQQATVSVSVTIDATAAEGESTTADVDVPEGSTVYDALVATGADVNASDSEYGLYVAGINGLAQLDHGPMSGWLFTVNGEQVNEACSELEVADGDAVTWTYVTEFTE